jgi:hypothetical protein
MLSLPAQLHRGAEIEETKAGCDAAQRSLDVSTLYID